MNIDIQKELKSSELYELLENIQLEKFWPTLVEAQITQLNHFNYVKPKDLEAIGMSKPAVRRLIDTVNKIQKQKLSIKPVRPAPPVPILSNESKLYNNKLNSTTLVNKINRNLHSTSSASSSSSIKSNESHSQHQPVSVLINSNDIQILKNNQNQDQVLGVGNFGIVKKAIWNSHTGAKIQVAVKCLHESKQVEAFNDLMNEISCMCGLDHKNLLKLYGIVLSSNQNKNIMMVTELASNGSLYTYLKKKRETNVLMPVNKLYSYVFQIASGMEYLELKKLIHRDLAARNILLYTYDHIKICDFGMTRSIKNEQNEIYKMKESHKIPAAWFAPESIKEKIFSIKSDVWMFGVTVWEVFTLCEHPWPNMTAAEILNKIDNESQRLPLPFVCSKSFYSIVYQCWSKNSTDRPSFQTLRKLIQSTKIIEMKAKKSFNEEDKLIIELNDLITIIDGDASRYWWKGQNNRSLAVGYFPRHILNPQRKLDAQDISAPLKDSFIHTGHMSSISKEKTWGNPGKIDPIFLISMNPPDLLSNLVDEDKNFKPNKNINNKNKSDPVQVVNSVDSTKAEDLIDLLDLHSEINNIQITYPDYNASIDSFDEYSSSSVVSSTQKANNQPFYMNEQFKLANQIYYNDDYTKQYNPLPQINAHQFQTTSNPIIENNRITATNNPFSNEIKFNNTNNNNHLATYSQQTKKTDTLPVHKPNVTNNNNNNLNVDDFLNKVMNDVLNDFKNIKVNK